jgi:TRAP transporter 4TM/12TM fusion protein
LSISDTNTTRVNDVIEQETSTYRNIRIIDKVILTCLALFWALFQLALPRLIILDSITVRAIHLAFALALVFLSIPAIKKPHKIKALSTKDYIPIMDYLLAFLGSGAALYIVYDWVGIAARSGLPTILDIMVGIVLIVLLIEAARRVIGPALSIIVIVLSTYAFIGPYMPSFLSYRGVSITKYISQIVLSTEGIYGIPLDVSATTVFLFVLFGAMLNRAGAGSFFIELALSLLGKYKGGPAKASVVASGLIGMVSGSSIANVVTTGTFTIPLMKKVGYPAKKAAAIEVAASTDGQLMPPIMGAAAFIIAEYLGLPYLAVIKAAAIPAFVSYFALFFITHLEASKLGLKGLAKSELPNIKKVLIEGGYYLIPIFVLVYELMFLRHSPKFAAFNAIIVLVIIIFIKELYQFSKKKVRIVDAIKNSLQIIFEGLISGSKNMISVAIATATAGIIVGIISMGIGSMIVQIVEVLAHGNFFLVLIITAIASLILGMGLPTTATYIVMASITVPIIVTLSKVAGISTEIPAIAAHLFCFYFGILADDTPPVGLASYAAAAIAKSPPISTGIQSFFYDMRTAIIPFFFILNSELILYEINNFSQVILIFVMAVLGAFCFTSAIQGWAIIKTKWYEVLLLLLATLVFFYPALLSNLLGISYHFRYLMFVFPLAMGCFVIWNQNKRKDIKQR